MSGPRASARPRATDLSGLPVTPDMLAGLAQAIAGGVTYVQYADRRVDFMSLADLLKAFQWVAAQLGIPGHTPARRVAAFSKGLVPGYCYGAVEHVEVADALWSRQIPRVPGQTTDTDWEQH